MDLQKAFEKWKNENDIESLIRVDDSFFHNVLCLDPKTNEFSVHVVSQGTYFQDLVIIYKFTNGQDLANMDTTDYEDDGEVQTEFLIDEEIGALNIAFDEYTNNFQW